MSHKSLITFLLAAMFCIPVSTFAAVGLLCPSQNEPPRILIINVEENQRSFFYLSKGVWSEPVRSMDVRHDRVEFGFYDHKVTINRKTMVMTTRLDVDWKYEKGSPEIQLSCSVHSVKEIEAIASREWERINQNRGF